MKKKLFSVLSMLVILGMFLSACAPAAEAPAEPAAPEAPAEPAATEPPAAEPPTEVPPHSGAYSDARPSPRGSRGGSN